LGGLVWLASYPKSGNTWTRSFLHHLLGEDEDDLDINRLNQVTTWDSAALWYRPLLTEPLESCAKQTVASVRPHANRRIAEHVENLIFVKTHNAMVADRGTPMVNPAVTAGAVYIVRNPLDVVISYSHHLGRTLDDTIGYMNRQGVQTQSSAHMAYEVQSSWHEHVWSWTRNPNRALFVMRYEDMLARPLATFTALTRFLQIEASRQRVRQAIEGASFDRLREQEQRSGFKEKPGTAKSFFREGRAGQWREVLSDEQVQTVIAANRDLMRRFGYLNSRS